LYERNANNVDIDYLTKNTFGVVALGPVVASARLSKDEVVGAEDLAVGSRANRVHGAGLQVDEDSPGNVLAAGGLIVVDVDALQL
jgi:hypothetical protein